MKHGILVEIVFVELEEGLIVDTALLAHAHECDVWVLGDELGKLLGVFSTAAASSSTNGKDNHDITAIEACLLLDDALKANLFILGRHDAKGAVERHKRNLVEILGAHLEDAAW